MRYEMLLCNLQKYHNGAAQAVSSSELEAAFSMSGREIRTAVNALRSAGEPICSDENGYYYAASEQELKHSIRQLDSRIGQIERAKKGLEKALPTYSNQNGGNVWNSPH